MPRTSCSTPTAGRALRTAPEGTLRVLVPYSIGLFELEPALAEFRRRYPLVQLVLIYDNNPLDLVEHGFDVALRRRRADGLQLHRALARLVAGEARRGPAYLDRVAGPPRAQDLAQHDLLLVGRDAPGLTLRLTNAAGEVADVPVRPVLITNESVTVLRQAASGGIALVSTHYTARRLERNEPKSCCPTGTGPTTSSCTCCIRDARRSTAAVRAFVEFLAEVPTIGAPPRNRRGSPSDYCSKRNRLMSRHVLMAARHIVSLSRCKTIPHATAAA